MMFSVASWTSVAIVLAVLPKVNKRYRLLHSLKTYSKTQVLCEHTTSRQKNLRSKLYILLYIISGTETTNSFCVFLCFTTPTCTESASGQPCPKITDSYHSVSRKHIAYLSITSCFSLFHLNPNLFFLLLATPYSSPHILDTLVLIISIFLSHPFQIIQQKPTSRSLYMGTGIHLGLQVITIM